MSETITPEKHFDDEAGRDGLGQSLGILRTLYMDKEAGRAAIEIAAPAVRLRKKLYSF